MGFTFWYRWLLTVSIVTAVVGAIVAIFPNSIVFDHHSEAIADTFFDGTLNENSNKMRSFLFGPIGGTISGYFILQTFIVWFPFHNREKWAWHAVLWGLIAWFLIDSSVSIYHGAFFNVWMINIWTLLLNGAPLMFTYKYFKS